jgi:hypothetical protein
MDVGGWFNGFVASLSAAVLLSLVGAISRWRRRDELRGATQVPADLSLRFLTRVAIAVGLVLLTLVVASTYYGSRQAGASVFGVPSNPLTWAILAGLWAVVLWQLVIGRLAPYAGGWSGITTGVLFWIFPVGPVAMAYLATPIGRLVDWDHFPGKGLLPYVALGAIYVAVPVVAFHRQNRRRRARSHPLPAAAASEHATT